MDQIKEFLTVSFITFGLATVFFGYMGMSFTLPVGATEFPATVITGLLSIASVVILFLMS